MRWIYVVLVASVMLVRSDYVLAQKPTIQTEEVTVEAVATGVSIDPADKATVTLNLRKSGATNLEARTNVRLFANQVTNELIALGIPKQNIDFEEPTNRLGFIGNEAMSAIMQDAGKEALPAKRQVSAAASLKLTISDLSLLARLRDFIDQNDAVIMENPTFSLSDDRSARNAAIADGVRKARLDTDAYAAALGMRVGRVISAYDQAAQSTFSFPDYDKMVERFTGRSDVKSGMVRTSANVIVKVGLQR